MTNDSLWNASYVKMIMINFLTYTAFNMLTPILPKYALSLGASLAMAGTISGLFAVTALLARPFAGFLADRANKKKLLLASSSALAAATLGYGLFPDIPMVLAIRVAYGLTFAVTSTTSASLGAMFIPRNKMGEGIGFLGLGFILATAAGTNLGLAVADNLGYRAVFVVASGLVIASMAMMITLGPQAARQDRQVPEIAGSRRLGLDRLFAVELLVPSILGCSQAFMSSLVGSFIALMADDRGIAGIGLYFTVNAAFLLFVRPISGKLLDRKGIAFILYPAIALSIAAAILLGLSASIWPVLLAGVLLAFGLGSIQPSLQAYCVNKLGPERVGVATSTYYVGLDLGFGVGPIIGGAIAGAFGFAALYYTGAAVLLAGMAVFAISNRKKSRWENEKRAPAGTGAPKDENAADQS